MQTICVLFGGVSPEHDISLRSAEAVLRNMKTDDRKILPVGITKTGQWLLFGGDDYAALGNGTWEAHPNNRKAFLSPVRGMGLCILGADDQMETVPVDVIFPVLHGENGEDGTIQGLFALSGIPYVGCGVLASAAAMDKSATKLIAAATGVRQADCLLLHRCEFAEDADAMCSSVTEKLQYPVFIKPCCTGSSVGVSKATNDAELRDALENAFRFDEKVLAEAFINGKEVEVAVLGNRNPIAATPGEIDTGAEFYDFDTKYVTSTSTPYIPARIPEETLHAVQDWAVKIYRALGCKGLSRVDFFVTRDTGEIVFNEINTLPGFTSISMYPKMFAADGVCFAELIEKIIALALEEQA